jgi:hypothetical protein
MTRGDLPRKWLYRPVKPVAIGTIMATSLLALNQFLSLTGREPLLYTPDGSIGAIFALATTSTLLMLWSWVAVSQRTYQVALILAVGVWAGRAVEVALAYDSAWQGALPLSLAVLIAGSYVLEAANEDTP